MDLNLPSKLNEYGNSFKRTCRLCGRIGRRFTDIFAELPTGKNTSSELSELIHSCVKLQVKENDGFPKKLCGDCMKKLFSWQQFYIKCCDTQRKLEKNFNYRIKRLSENNAENSDNKENLCTELEFHSERINSSNESKKPKKNTCGPKKQNSNKKYSAGSRKAKRQKCKTKYHKVSSSCRVVGAAISDSGHTKSATECIGASGIVQIRTDDKQNIIESAEDKGSTEDLGSTTLKEDGYQKESEKNVGNIEAMEVSFSGVPGDPVDSLNRDKDDVSSEEVEIHSADQCSAQGQSDPSRFASDEEEIKTLISDKSNSENNSKDPSSKKSKINEKSIYHCHICERNILHKYRYDLHMAMHDDKREYKCDKCSKTLRSKCSLRYHMMTHSENHNYCCHVCGQLFRSASSLCNHVRLHSEAKHHVCSLCGKAFHQSYSLQVHMRSHTGEKPYSCSECGHRFAYRSKLNLHIKTVHHQIRKKRCNACGKELQNDADFQDHMLAHHGLRNMKCDICGKCFFSKNSLFRHRRSHTGEKPFECGICGKRFADWSNRKRHMDRHQKPGLVPSPELQGTKRPSSRKTDLVISSEEGKGKTYTSLRSFLESSEVAEALSDGKTDERSNSEDVEYFTFLTSDSIGNEIQETFFVSETRELADCEMVLNDTVTLHAAESLNDGIVLQQGTSNNEVPSFQEVDDDSNDLDAFLVSKNDVLNDDILQENTANLVDENNILQEAIEESDNLLEAFLASENNEQPNDIDMNIMGDNSDEFAADPEENMNIIEISLAPSATDSDLSDTFGSNLATKSDHLLFPHDSDAEKDSVIQMLNNLGTIVM
ncbi:zinc finger protein 37-like isoform X1 [Schistocerca gregaria]|uniref:zinc finger protein 37-like isoform X1 n=1 Tax=Schistocerca gregaria TaxID=7010 RepID=UPI00211EB7F6|nr:zinc finger protein 37-like isoform X1 [Schistocerca gregaria]